MEGWLLGKEAFIDFLSGKAELIAWAKSKGSGTLYVSEFTWAAVRLDAESASGLKRQRWLERLDTEVPRQFGPRLLAVDRSVLETWSQIGNEPVGARNQTVDVDESIAIATAVRHALIYVVRNSPLSEKLKHPTESAWP